MDGLGGVLDDTCGIQHQDGVGTMSLNDKYIRHSAAVGEGIRSQSGTVIIDIAACDGPVFFERVINRAYKANVSTIDICQVTLHFITCPYASK